MNASGAGVIECPSHSNSIRIATAEQSCSRCGTDRLSDTKIRKSCSFSSKPIKHRRANLFRTVTAKVSVTQVVRNNHDDVGRRVGGVYEAGCEECEERQAEGGLKKMLQDGQNTRSA